MTNEERAKVLAERVAARYVFEPYDRLQVRGKSGWLDYCSIREASEATVAMQHVEGDGYEVGLYRIVSMMGKGKYGPFSGQP